MALLTSQGRAYERAKFRELEDIFPQLVIRGELKDFDAEEDRAFHPIRLSDHIDALTEYQFALEAEYEVTEGFVIAHQLADLHDGTAVADGEPLNFEGARPRYYPVASRRRCTETHNYDRRRIAEHPRYR